VHKTTNYADVLTLTSRIALEGRFLLLETLATRVANAILDFDNEITSVSVGVRKLQPPVPEDVATVGVRCTRRR
jgi:dihydroneopterin aldolase